MSVRSLAPDIVSLIHHVELNESGWWKKAVSQVVKGVLWKGGESKSMPALRSALREELGIRIDDSVLENQLSALIRQDAVIRIGDSFKLTEAAAKQLSRDHQAAMAEQEGCHLHFVQESLNACPQLDPEVVWAEFSKALVHSIRIAGANLFHLLRDGNLRRDVDWMAEFMGKFGPEHFEGLRAVVESFFAPGNVACRAQVLRFLTAHFFAEAAQLNPETIEAIERGAKSRVIRVVMDTNFIFSVLGLHENPADEAAKSLVELASNSKGKLDVRLYVLPSTLDEARRVLAYHVGQIEGIRPSRSLAAAATSQPMSSIARKFFESAAKVGHLSARDFFQPYIDDLQEILKGHNILILEAQREYYHKRQDVIDDVMSELEKEAARTDTVRSKGYEALLHDAVLWHAIADRRSSTAESPFDVEYWGVSIDWRLINFDQTKRRARGAKVPIILHPNNLVQLIQFWVPRTPQLEETLIDAIKLPLFFQAFDADDEKATVKVLEQLSRFENIDDLPEATIRKILANKVLRTRITELDASNEATFELVREEVVSLHQGALDELNQTRSSLKETADSLADVLDKNGIAARELERQRTLNVQAENELAAATRATESLRCTIERIKFVACVYGLPFVVSALLAVGLYVAQAYNFAPSVVGWKRWLLAGSCFVAPFVIACVSSRKFVERSLNLRDWWPAKFSRWIGGALITLALITIGAVYQGGVWDGVKSAMGLTETSKTTGQGGEKG